MNRNGLSRGLGRDAALREELEGELQPAVVLVVHMEGEEVQRERGGFARDEAPAEDLQHLVLRDVLQALRGVVLRDHRRVREVQELDLTRARRATWLPRCDINFL